MGEVCMLNRLTLLSALMMSVGCGQQQYSRCDPPDEHLKVMFKPKIDVLPFSHSFCIVCNIELAPEEYGDWALEMGGQPPSSVEDVYPCLYVYTSNNTDIETLNQCDSLVCEGGAEYNDMVGRNNGNFDLDPLFVQ